MLRTGARVSHLRRCSPLAELAGPKLHALPHAAATTPLHAPPASLLLPPALSFTLLLQAATSLLQLPQALPEVVKASLTAAYRGDLAPLLLVLRTTLRKPNICACCAGVRASRASQLRERMLLLNCRSGCCAERGAANAALGAAEGPGACLPGLRPHATGVCRRDEFDNNALADLCCCSSSTRASSTCKESWRKTCYSCDATSCSMHVCVCCGSRTCTWQALVLLLMWLLPCSAARSPGTAFPAGSKYTHNTLLTCQEAHLV
jgi:hypothetical protein